VNIKIDSSTISNDIINNEMKPSGKFMVLQVIPNKNVHKSQHSQRHSSLAGSSLEKSTEVKDIEKIEIPVRH
jgi:hypothetical protein